MKTVWQLKKNMIQYNLDIRLWDCTLAIILRLIVSDQVVKFG
jgi:hypothetical protein